VLLAPTSQPEANRAWTYSLRNGTPLEMELSLLGRDGRYRPFLTRAVPLRDATSSVCGWIGTHVDISEQKRREEHVRLIIEELSHRTKNLLAVVMAVARQTAQYADNVKLYETRFLERLQALSYCHDLLVRDRWQGASLHDLISAQMSPFDGPGWGRINASGPRLVLRADAVQHLGLALHELATNASKHGALSTPHGEVAIRWQLEEADDRIKFSWHENGGPPVVPPQRRGFGRVVIEQIVPRALNGSGKLEFQPSGVSWTFEFCPAE
jgi:two-component sensor histidine kinase